MRWSQVLAWWAVAMALALTLVRLTPRAPDGEPDPQSGRDRVLGLDLTTLAEVTIEHEGRRVVARREGESWAVEEPAGAAVPSDLVAALATALVEAEVIDHAEAAGGLAPFGLDQGATRIELRPSGGPPETLWLGGSNPPGTAIYARRLGSDGVLLVGRTLRYYTELIFDALPKVRVPPDTAGKRVGGRRPLTIRGRRV